MGATGLGMHMELRALRPSDAGAVHQIAQRSLQTDYADILSDQAIEDAVGTWYDEGAVEEYCSGDEMMFVVASIDDDVIGFCQSHVLDERAKGRILWLHVDPDHRGDGYGSDLLEGMIDQLHERGVAVVTAVVLAAHEAGVSFYEAHGFDRMGRRSIEIGGDPYEEVILRESAAPDEPLERVELPDRDPFYLDYQETDRGSDGSFVAAYRDPDREHRYGWFCCACESVDTAMDTMGRITCTDCGNTRRPTRWDAAYL